MPDAVCKPRGLESTSAPLSVKGSAGKPQLRDLNPNTLWAASPQDLPPGRPQIFGFKPERDLTSENLLKLDEQKLLTLRPPMPKVPVNPTNESTGQAKDPGMTGATVAGEAKKLPAECGPPKDDKSHNLKGKLKPSQLKPANEITPAMDATEGCQNLVDSSARPKGICKSFSMADGYTYTPGHQEVTHCHSFLLHFQTNSRSSVSPTYSPQEPVDQPPKLYCPLGAPFDLVHFTEYPPNQAYSEFTLETRETETVYREGTKVTIPPLTLRPNCLQESVTANKSTSTQIFGVMYITLTGH
ncbi:hypothetical protein DSO57_1029779 [Entomophthora muscae]|uniref:Uncharacterized protein n=1 Tax=Entomophthora muscae TaxID=34485 RepID=A0ACC2RS63_9FUNG|nr:hypothetical protein DSO57_1029779 [Entomophthora muscae]